jgi:hypothetical protein
MRWAGCGIGWRDKMMEDLVISCLLAALATIAHALTASAIIEVVVQALEDEKRLPKYLFAFPVVIMLIWWVVFSLLLEVVG